jgi:hypothetical protein
LFVVTVAAGLLLAGRASAVPPTCQDDCPDPGPVITHPTIMHKLTVNRPATGTVTSSLAGIDCPAGSGGTCVVSDAQTVTCVDGECTEPDDALWATYTLSASGGAAGFGPSWSGSCSGATCTTKLTAARTVTLGWQDIENPTVALTGPGAKVGKTMSASANASDNAGVARVEFYVDGVLKETDSSAPYGATIAMDGYAHGTGHTLLARAYDAAGRIADASKSVSLDKDVKLTLGTVPAFTNAAAVPLTIGTDADATLKCQLGGGAQGPCAGTFSPVTAASADGTYTYTVTATDDVANTAGGSRSFVLDRTAPAISAFDGPVEGGQVTTDAVTITYGVTDANPDVVACALDGAAVACGPTAAALSNLADGPHSFTVTARDKAGNEGSKVRAFSVKAGTATTPPPLPVTNPPASGGEPAAPPAGGGKVTTTTITTTTTTAGGVLANPALFRYGFSRDKKGTAFTKLTLTGVAAGSAIKATCKGGGCPKKAFGATKPGTVNLTAFLKRRLRPGAVLSVEVSKPGMTTKRVRLTVRKGQDPKLG